MLNRHRGQIDLIQERLNKFNEELSHWNEYSYVVINDDLNKCYEKILGIISDEKKGIKKDQNFDEIKKKIDELLK